MNLAASILGTSTCAKLTESAEAAILQIGSDRLTRGDLAKVGCYNFLAAKILSRVLHDELQVKSLRQVYNEIPPSALALPHLGVISLAVLGAAFEAKGIGGDTPLESYVRKHVTKVTTFFTLKHREQQERERERKDRKRRKARRRDQAHQLRVERFTDQPPTT